MRPRPDAAENRVAAERIERRREASMRPRPDAAENRRPDPHAAATRNGLQ